MIVVIEAVLSTFHLFVAGLAGGGPLLVGGLRLWWSRMETEPASDAGLRQLAVWSVGAVVLAAVTGLVAGAWRAGVGQGGYLEMLARFPSRAYLMVAIEWVFSIVCYGGWLALWNRWSQKPWRHGLLALLGATNLLYHFPLLMISQNLLVEQPNLVAESVVARPLVVQLFHTPLVMAKASHIWAMCMLVSSCGLLMAAPVVRLHRVAGVVGLVALVVQFVSGAAVLGCLPADQTQRITGGSILATALLVLGVLMGIHLLMSFAKLALNPASPAQPGLVSGMVVGVMLLMSLAARL